MKNWNTDTQMMKKGEKRIWELAQLINYGLDGVKLKEKELKKSWNKLSPHLRKDRANMLKWLIWGQAS